MIRLACAALLLAVRSGVAAQTKPTLVVPPATFRTSDPAVARRAETFVNALRRDLSVDSTILWMPVTPEERPRDRNGAPLGARYIVGVSADTAASRRVQIEVRVIDVSSGEVLFKRAVSIGKDVRDDAAAVAARIAASVRTHGHR